MNESLFAAAERWYILLLDRYEARRLRHQGAVRAAIGAVFSGDML